MGWIEYLINYPHLVLENNIHSEEEALKHYADVKDTENPIFDTLINKYNLTLFKKDCGIEELDEKETLQYWVYFAYNKININNYIIPEINETSHKVNITPENNK